MKKPIEINSLPLIRKELVNEKKDNSQLKKEIIQLKKEIILQKAHRDKIILKLEIAQQEQIFQDDLKEQKATELSSANYARSLIEASIDPLVTISSNGKIIDVNEASIKVTGVERNKLIGTEFSSYFIETKKAKQVYREVFNKGFVNNYPLTIKHLNGKLTEVLYNASVFKDTGGRVIGAFAAARDVTEQNRITTELNDAKVLAEFATSIAEDAKSKAEDAVKAKQQFLSNMSHEIRTPMNAIIGFTKVVLKTELSIKQNEYLTAIKMSGDALIVLINDILDLAKVDAGKMTFEELPFKLTASLKAMLQLFETKIQEKNLVLIKEYDDNIPFVLLGDPVRLHQIILNLVSNAVKFTSKGEIKIGAKLLSEDDKKVTIEISVADTGIGIPANEIKNIFENFKQASNDTSRLYGGTGLGLAIVKQLVEQQGGKIKVVSKLGEGSKFSFKLDFKKTDLEAEIEADIIAIDKDITNIKVLVVEDIALNQLLMKTLLDDFGFERDIAENGKVAIEMLGQKDYDIILMDLQMPQMNGFEATEYIRNTMKSNIPIIALTADVTTVDVAKCREVGMNDYIAKPVNESLLYSKIIGLVQKNAWKVQPATTIVQTIKYRYVNLEYLNKRTKSNTKLMMEMITAYLDQTPTLIQSMKSSLESKDWVTLQAASHKMIPSFSIIGMDNEFEIMAKKVHKYAVCQIEGEKIHLLLLALEHGCSEACKELQEEYSRMNDPKIHLINPTK